MCGPGKLKIETCFRYDPICCQWSIRSMLGYGLCPSRQWKPWAASPLAISLPVCTMIPLLRSCSHWFHTYYKLCFADCGRWLVLIYCKKKVLLADADLMWKKTLLIVAGQSYHLLTPATWPPAQTANGQNGEPQFASSVRPESIGLPNGLSRPSFTSHTTNGPRTNQIVLSHKWAATVRR